MAYTSNMLINIIICLVISLVATSGKAEYSGTTCSDLINCLKRAAVVDRACAVAGYKESTQFYYNSTASYIPDKQKWGQRKTENNIYDTNGLWYEGERSQQMADCIKDVNPATDQCPPIDAIPALQNSGFNDPQQSAEWRVRWLGECADGEAQWAQMQADLSQGSIVHPEDFVQAIQDKCGFTVSLDDLPSAYLCDYLTTNAECGPPVHKHSECSNSAYCHECYEISALHDSIQHSNRDKIRMNAQFADDK